MYDYADYWHLEMSAMFHKQHAKSLESRSTDYEHELYLLMNCDVLSSVEICSHLKLQKTLGVSLTQVSLVYRHVETDPLKAPAFPRSYEM